MAVKKVGHSPLTLYDYVEDAVVLTGSEELFPLIAAISIRNRNTGRISRAVAKVHSPLLSWPTLPSSRPLPSPYSSRPPPTL